MTIPFDRYSYVCFREFNPLFDDALPFPLPESMESNAAHEDLSAHYQQAYAGGDENALLEFAKEDAFAFRSGWFRTQIERLRLQGTVASMEKLDAVMRAYTSSQGQRTYETMIDLIQRDHEVFKAVSRLHMEGVPLRTSRKQDGCYSRVAQQFSTSEGTVETAYKSYLRLIKDWGPERQDDVFPWLDEMMLRLQKWGNEGR